MSDANPDGQAWVCIVCGFIYHPNMGAPEVDAPVGTKFEDLPVDYICPVCGVGKDLFEQLQ